MVCSLIDRLLRTVNGDGVSYYYGVPEIKKYLSLSHEKEISYQRIIIPHDYTFLTHTVGEPQTERRFSFL